MSHLYKVIPVAKYNSYKGYRIGRYGFGYTGEKADKFCSANTLEGLFKTIDQNN